MIRRRRWHLLLLGLFLVSATAACGGKHRLDDFDFRGATLGMAYGPAPYPELRWGRYTVNGDDPVRAALEVGSQAARELEARNARARLDTAMTRVELGRLMAWRTTERAARYLGARPSEQEAGAQYVVEMDIERLGINPGASQGAIMYLEAQMVLLDSGTGAEIWQRRVNAWDRLTPSVSSGDPISSVAGDIVAVGVLKSMGVDDFERVLGRLVDLSVDALMDDFRDDLRKVRRQR